jgi:outer membrane protein assembly factor BamB
MIEKLLALLLLPFCATAAMAEQWTQFRGPNSSGVSTESTNLPVEFSFEEKVLWSAALGEGIACPVISRGKVCATTMTDEQKFAVVCFDAASGDEIWRREFEAGDLPAIMSPNIPASSTPAVDEKRVYAYFSTIGMIALDLNDGQVVWKRPLPEPHYLMGWGAAHSPIVYNDLLILNQDDDLEPCLIALDKRTGEVVWKTPRPEMLAGYAVPVVCRGGEREDIVVAGSGKLKGYDPLTGKELWTCNTLLRTIMTTPVVVDDSIYVSLQSYGDTDRVLRFALLEWKDTNQDGQLDKSEVGEAFGKKFELGDKNEDGFLVDDEIDAAFQASTNMVGGGSTIQAVRGGGEGDVTATHVRWNLDHKVPSNIVSPLVVDGRLFIVKKGGISACFDVGVGETVWMKKRIGNLGNYYASPVAGVGNIYVMGENVFLTVL